MQAHKVRGRIDDDGSLTVANLPFPAGEEVEVVVIADTRDPRQDHVRYPLRGTAIQYIDPTNPIAVDDWKPLL